MVRCNKMTVEEKKRHFYGQLAQLEEETEILKNNVVELRQILETVQTEEDFERLRDFDIEKGLNMIELF